MSTDLCALCQHPKSRYIPTNVSDIAGYECPRCGRHFISAFLVTGGSTLAENRFRLACIAFEWHLRFPQTPFVLIPEAHKGLLPQETFPSCRIFALPEMIEAFPRGSQIFERAMLNLSRIARHPLDGVPLDEGDLPYALFSEDIDPMTTELEELEYILIDTTNATLDTRPLLRIRPAGWLQIERWRELTAHTDSKQGFVAMWFASEMDEIYRNGIEPAIKMAGYEPKVINRIEHNNKIDDEIIAEIRKSRFVVADFTAGCCRKCESCERRTDATAGPCRDRVRPRGGVYFEAGFAMGLGTTVIWTVREDQADQLHFDTRQYNHILYRGPEDLSKKLYQRIGASVGHNTR
jgi:hypothetical protein